MEKHIILEGARANDPQTIARPDNGPGPSVFA
jgi:hypothetical protein